MKNHVRFIALLAGLLTATIAAPALAGTLDAPGTPTTGSGMPTTADIYNRLDTGAAVSVPGTFQEPAAGPTAGTGKTLGEIAAKLPVPDNSNGAVAADVANGKTFWGLRTDGTWGLKSGAMAAGSNITGANGVLIFPIPDAFYTGGKTITATDSNLLSGNIKSGITLFGVTGTLLGMSPNTAPVANAGLAQNVNTGATVTLNGSASNDANGDALTYEWTLAYKPAGSTAGLAGATTAAPAFTADQIGTYVATLIVNDGLANSTTAIVTVTSSSSNIAPVANTVSALTKAVGLPIALDASASSDANGDTLNYSWNLTALPAGSSATLTGAITPTPTFTPDMTGTYGASLVVNDGLVNSVTAATVNITVVPRFSAVTGGCVLDNSTGLTWEVKTTDGGLRDWTKTYTNFSATYDPVSQYGSTTDASGFATAVNGTNLCAYSDWRLPTSSELRGIVESSVSPSINASWFPNTQATRYWSSSPMSTNAAYGVNFLDGSDVIGVRQVDFYLRLVR